MGPVYDVKCEVVENEFCPYTQKEYLFCRLTPKGLCAASFAAIWPFANAMRHSEKTGFEDAQGHIILSCPDGWVRFRLSRIISRDQPQTAIGNKSSPACKFD